MKMKVNNPYFDEFYETDETTKRQWLGFLDNYQRGNEDIFFFTDKNTGKAISICPKNFASIEVED